MLLKIAFHPPNYFGGVGEGQVSIRMAVSRPISPHFPPFPPIPPIFRRPARDWETSGDADFQGLPTCCLHDTPRPHLPALQHPPSRGPPAMPPPVAGILPPGRLRPNMVGQELSDDEVDSSDLMVFAGAAGRSLKPSRTSNALLKTASPTQRLLAHADVGGNPHTSTRRSSSRRALVLPPSTDTDLLTRSPCPSPTNRDLTASNLSSSNRQALLLQVAEGDLQPAASPSRRPPLYNPGGMDPPTPSNRRAQLLAAVAGASGLEPPTPSNRRPPLHPSATATNPDRDSPTPSNRRSLVLDPM